MKGSRVMYRSPSMLSAPRAPRRQVGNSLAYAALALIVLGLALGIGLWWMSSVNNNAIRRSIAQLEQYQAATATFKRRFEKLPGDIPYATRLWGAARGTADNGYNADCANLTKPEGKLTCNGNGDGWPYDRLATSPPQQYERFRFWQHLTNAELISGAYTGIGGPHNRREHHVPGVNSPQTAFEDGVTVVTSVSKPNGDVNLWPNPAHLRIELRSDYHNRLAVMTPQQLLELDQKMDDGKPASGKVQSYSTMRQPDCTTTNNAATTQYNTAKDTIACSLVFFLDR